MSVARGPVGAVAPRSDGYVPFPAEALTGSVADRFFAVVDAHPGATALRSPSGASTYAELGAEVRRVAAGVRAEVGDGPPAPVAVLAAHDGPLVVAILGVIAAGHVVVVIDPLAPGPQTEHVLAECAPAVVLHDAAHASAASALATPERRAVDLAELRGDEGAPLPRRTPEQPVMLAFTSGTSGDPKAAVITHGVLLNLVRGATDALGIGPADRMPMLFPVSLAVAAYPMFLPLLNGGTLATLDVRSEGLAPIAGFFAGERITVAYMAPTVVRFLVDALAGCTFPDLRLVALGGEQVDAEVVALTRELFGPRWIANGYGTTETGVVTLFTLDRDDDPGGGTVPVGPPVPDVELVLLDDHGRPAAPGDAGEVVVVSPHLFTGYWGHPELNRQVLSPDPQGRPGWRCYRTGDFGRIDDDGVLTVLGRVDTRVKVRGRPVVLGDVEAAIQQLDEVADAAVVALRHDGVVELVAHVVPATDPAPTGASLRARLLEVHESYRVPSRWVLVDELPRLPNGKVDRRALPEVDPGTGPADGGDDGATAAERASVRERIRAIWERLLPVGAVGVDEEFAAAGGDSLLAAQMLLVVEEELGVVVPMGALVHARTVRQLAEVVARLQRTAASAPTSTVARLTTGDEPARPRLWFVHDLHGSAYRVRHLAEALGADQPLWSFESPLLAGEPNRFTSLATFAARYLTDLRAAQPEGPYWLAGYSFGGICAYEMARQLVADGQEVAFLGVVDVGPSYRGPGWSRFQSPLRPWFGVAQPPPAGAGPADVARHYASMARRSPLGTARHLMVRSGAARLVDPLRFKADIGRHGAVRKEWRLWYAWEEHWKIAAKGWDRSSTYPGRLDLFWASGSGATDGTMGWGPLVGDLEIHRFTGDHETTLDASGAPALATMLRAAIDRAIV